MKTNNETTRQRWTIAISAIPLLVGACIGIWLLMGGSSRFGPSFDNTSRTRTVSRVSTNPSLSPGVGIRDIEDIRVGERVFAHNPQLSDEEHNIPDPDPAIWRKLDLAITKDDGYRLDITLLRPLEWLEERKAVVGGTVSLDIPEMNAYGVATVLNISECPPIKSGPGRVVIGTFRHTSGDTLNVGISGLDKPIGTTADHPFWSEDRQEFVAVGRLSIGEHVRTFTGEKAEITSISRRGPPEPVYNLEVYGEHVFHVSQLGILVHNSYDGNPSKSRSSATNAEPLLLTHQPTTKTLAQVRRLQQPEKWQKGEQYIRELYGSTSERHFPIPGTGGRFVDSPVDLSTGGILGGEVKTYGKWRTVKGSPQQQSVPLSSHIRQQIERDVWLRDNHSNFDPRWIFLDASPSQELLEFLNKHQIVTVVHN